MKALGRLLFVLLLSMAANGFARAQTDDESHWEDTVAATQPAGDVPEESEDYADKGSKHYTVDDEERDEDYDHEDGSVSYTPLYEDGVRVDTAFAPAPRSIGKNGIAPWKNNESFYYEDEPLKKEEKKKEEEVTSSRGDGPNFSFIGKFLEWLSQSHVGPFLFWSVVVGIGILLVFTLVGPGFGIFRRSPGNNAGAEAEEEKELSPLKSDLEQALEKALSAGNFRLAVRIMYLAMLKSLIDRNMVTYRDDKTNFEYARELQGTRFYDDFFKMTRVFEYTWYGKFELTEAMFAQVREGYENFISIRY